MNIRNIHLVDLHIFCTNHADCFCSDNQITCHANSQIQKYTSLSFIQRESNGAGLHEFSPQNQCLTIEISISLLHKHFWGMKCSFHLFITCFQN